MSCDAGSLQGEEDLGGESSDGGGSSASGSSAESEEEAQERQRIYDDYYDVDDDFVDDSDFAEADRVDARKSKHSGFYVNKARPAPRRRQRRRAMHPSPFPPLPYAQLCGGTTHSRARTAAFPSFLAPQGTIERSGEPAKVLEPVFKPQKRKLDLVCIFFLERIGPVVRCLVWAFCLPCLRRGERRECTRGRIHLFRSLRLWEAMLQILLALQLTPAWPGVPQKPTGGNGPPLKARRLTAQPLAQATQISGPNPFAAAAAPGAAGGAQQPRVPSVPSLSAAVASQGAELQGMMDDPISSLFAPKQMPVSQAQDFEDDDDVTLISPSGARAFLCAPCRSDLLFFPNVAGSPFLVLIAVAFQGSAETSECLRAPLHARPCLSLRASCSAIPVSTSSHNRRPPPQPSLAENGARKPRAPIEYDPPAAILPLMEELRVSIQRVRKNIKEEYSQIVATRVVSLRLCAVLFYPPHTTSPHHLLLLTCVTPVMHVPRLARIFVSV